MRYLISLILIFDLSACGQFKPGNMSGRPIEYPRAEQQEWDVIDYDRITKPAKK